MQTRKISVILTCYNGREWIGGAIESVLAQTLGDFELAVVNDGSADDSKAVIAGYLSDKRIIYAEQENRGVANARNRGLSMTEGGYVCVLDQDDLWLPGKLEAQAGFLDREPQAAAVYTGVERINGEGKSLGPRIFQSPLEGDLFRSFLSRGVAVPIVSVMFRRGTLEGSDGFDEKLFGKDDFDLLLRIARDSRIGFIPEVLTRQRFRPGTAGQSEPMFRDSFYLAEKFRELWPGESRLIAEYEAGARYHYGSVLMSSGRRSDAREQFRALLSIKPLHLKGLLKYLSCYV
jgi:glycosyltransferase involved in cell wall biosynthesis